MKPFKKYIMREIDEKEKRQSNSGIGKRGRTGSPESSDNAAQSTQVALIMFTSVIGGV